MNVSDQVTVPEDIRFTSGEATIVTVLEKRAELHPEKTAFTFLADGGKEEHAITYLGLASSASKIASKLEKLGMKGKKVLMFYPSGLEFISAFFGCLYAGAIPVPAYPPRKNRSLQRIHAIVKDCGAVSVLTTSPIAKQLERNFAEDPVLRDLVWHATELWTAEDTASRSGYQPALNDLAFLQYTSGSTGTPKGVMVSHRNIMYNLLSLKQFFKITKDDITVNWVPQFHDLGLIMGILETVYAGICAVLIAPVDFISNPFFMLQTIDRYRATITGQPDFAFNLCVDKIGEEQRKSLDLSSLRILYSGAEPIRKTTFDRFLAAFSIDPGVLTPGYGMAESTLVLTVSELSRPPLYLPLKASSLEKNLVETAREGDEDIRWITSNGKPAIDTVLEIVDPDTCRIVPAGVVGEIWAKGNTIGMGYLGNPELSSEVFNASPEGLNDPHWLRTGDLGFIHNGELFITGRIKDLIIIHGRNFYPQDIEMTAEESNSSIRKNCSAAFSIEVRNEERLAVVAELHRSILPLDKEKIMDQVVAAISRDYEIQPARVILIRTGSLPKTSSGKIMRRATREMLLGGKLDILAERILEEKEIEQFDIDGQPDLEKFLLKWLAYHLNNGQPVDPSKGIADYGMDSLRAVLLGDDTKSMFGFEWPPYLFFEQLSIQEMIEEGKKMMDENDGRE